MRTQWDEVSLINSLHINGVIFELEKFEALFWDVRLHELPPLVDPLQFRRNFTTLNTELFRDSQIFFALHLLHLRQVSGGDGFLVIRLLDLLFKDAIILGFKFVVTRSKFQNRLFT